MVIRITVSDRVLSSPASLLLVPFPVLVPPPDLMLGSSRGTLSHTKAGSYCCQLHQTVIAVSSEPALFSPLGSVTKSSLHLVVDCAVALLLPPCRSLCRSTGQILGDIAKTPLWHRSRRCPASLLELLKTKLVKHDTLPHICWNDLVHARGIPPNPRTVARLSGCEISCACWTARC